jgi:hypothetical protein
MTSDIRDLAPEGYFDDKEKIQTIQKRILFLESEVKRLMELKTESSLYRIEQKCDEILKRVPQKYPILGAG